MAQKVNKRKKYQIYYFSSLGGPVFHPPWYLTYTTQRSVSLELPENE